jgi:hypothetical protein
VRSEGNTGRFTDIPDGSRVILERYGEIGSRYSKIRGDPCRLQRDLGKIQRDSKDAEVAPVAKDL